MVATFTNHSNGAPIELLVKGDWFDRSATITMGNQVIATIGRSYFNMREIFGGQQTVSPLLAIIVFGRRKLTRLPVLRDCCSRC